MKNNQINLNQNITSTLQKFLGSHKGSYFIIGGHAAAYNLSLQGLSFRVTRDYDIVIVSEIADETFGADLTNLLISGKYQFGYKAGSNKKIAYRFESPKDLDYPEIIEFFVKEGVEIHSLDNRFAKLNIEINDDKISAMVLNKEVYDFSKNHVVEINGLMFVDKQCLVALKAYAYFENLELYRNGKITSDNYLKHVRDILRIISSFSPDEIIPIADLPPLLKKSLIDVLPILIKNVHQLKDYGINKEYVTRTINILSNISN